MSSRAAWSFLIGILIVQAILTLSAIDRSFLPYGTSGLAELRALVKDGVIPTNGLRAFGEGFHHPGPLYILLLAIPYLCWPHIVSGYYFLGICNGLTALGVFLMGKRFFNVSVGLWAAAFYVGSWVAIAPRDLESISFVPLFVLCVMAATSELVIRKRSAAVIFLLPLFIATLQLHLSALSLVPVIGWALWASRKSLRARDMFIGLGASLILMAPYCIRGWWEDLPALMGLMHNPRLHRDAPYLAVLGTGLLLEPNYFTAIHAYPFDFHVVGRAISLSIWGVFVFWLGAVWHVVRWSRSGLASSLNRPTVIMLFLWNVAPLFLWGLSEPLLVIHYLLPAKMGSFFISALLAAKLTSRERGVTLSRFRHWLRPMLRASCLAGLLLANAIAYERPFLWNQTVQIPQAYGFVARTLSGQNPEWFAPPRVGQHPMFRQRSIFDQ